MTSEQAFATLGLSSYRGQLVAQGGGSANYFWMSYLLHNGHGLLLFCDYTEHTNGVVIKAELDGATWPKNEKDTSH